MANLSSQEAEWLARLRQTPIASTLSETFLAELVAELDDDSMIALILHGSYAHGDATAYSDIDISRIFKDEVQSLPLKRYVIRHGYLVSISAHTISEYRERFTLPQEAIFAIPTVRQARILLEREHAFSLLQHEAEAFTWEPLQPAANRYVSRVLEEYTEHVLKILRALALQDILALAEMVPALVMAATDAIAVQRGILITSGNTYFRQVQESVGFDSSWTTYHRRAAAIDIDVTSIKPLEASGFAALRLYRETVLVLQPYLDPQTWEVARYIVTVIEQTGSPE